MKKVSNWLQSRAGMLTLGLGVIFLAAGVIRGEPAVVLQKAANICLECIGIG